MMDFLHQIVDSVMSWITHLGHWGIMLGLMIEIIPSEIVLAFGGYLVSTGDINFWMAVLFGVIGGVIAQIFVYWIGRYGGRPFLERYGKYIFITKHHIDVSEDWFNKYGTGVIFTARFIPVVRHAISIPAGIVRMPLMKFTILTTLAIIPWSILFVYLGKTLGENWKTIDEKAAPYVHWLMYAAIAAIVLYVAYKLWKRGKKKSYSQGYETSEKQHTAQKLRSLGADYRVLNTLTVRSSSSSQSIDHVVVGPNGVFHVDTKWSTGNVYLAEPADAALSVGEAGAAKPGEDPTAQLYRHEFALKELLREQQLQADVVGILLYPHPEVRLIGKSPAFAAMKPDQLVAYIQASKPKHPLSQEQVAEIAKQIENRSKPVR